ISRFPHRRAKASFKQRARLEIDPHGAVKARHPAPIDIPAHLLAEIAGNGTGADETLRQIGKEARQHIAAAFEETVDVVRLRRSFARKSVVVQLIRIEQKDAIEAGGKRPGRGKPGNTSPGDKGGGCHDAVTSCNHSDFRLNHSSKLTITCRACQKQKGPEGPFFYWSVLRFYAIASRSCCR